MGNEKDRIDLQMNRVKNRNMSPVNGWHYHQPQTGWDLQKNAPSAAWDFNGAVQAIIAHRKANPRFNLATDQKTVEDQLDETNALRMLSIPGADIYVQTDPTQLPKTTPRPLQRLQSVAVGASTVVEWIASEEEAVPKELANKRAEICTTCPMNDPGGLMDRFTAYAQNAIRFALNQRKGWNLTTPFDERLHVCSACLCPIPLKIWMPLSRIRAKMPKESFASLAEFCWIRKSDG